MTAGYRSNAPSPWGVAGAAVEAVAKTATARPAAIAAGATVLLSALFVAAPGLDLAVSAAFHDPEHGFWAKSDPALTALRSVGLVAGKALAIALVLALACPFLFAGRRLLMPARSAAWLAATLLLGSGLLVNLVLKDHWGRARPAAVAEFGGTAVFTPAWAVSDACSRNCSFVSGEASSAVVFALLAVLIWSTGRRGLSAGLVVFAAALSLNRIAMGGHFLSDVLLAWTLTGLVAALAAAVIEPARPASDRSLETALGAAGSRLRRFVADIGRRRRQRSIR